MPILNKINTFKLLLILQAFEISFFGSGRLLQIGPLTLRMYIFIIIILISLTITKRINKNIFFIISITTLSFCFSIVLGIYKGNNLNLIFEDIKPLLLIFELPFIFYVINSNAKIYNELCFVYKISGLSLSLLFLSLIFCVLIGVVSFSEFHSWASNTGEFFFRSLGNNLFAIGFFYKGFIYIGIGLFFFFFSPNKKSIIFVPILAFALIMTLTRGFLLSLIITICCFYLFEKKRKAFIYIPIITLIIYFSINYYLAQLGNKESSDEIRLQDIFFILHNTNLFTFFFGHGFGSLINNRVNVENSFLEIFYIQGTLGIIPYVIILFKLYLFYFKIEKQQRILFAPFFYGVIFIFIISLTNPFINNPIGMFFLLIAYCVLFNNKLIIKSSL